MSVNLQKGQRVDLRKDASSGGGELKRVMVGLGWDEVKKGGFFRKQQDIDCDATAFLCNENGKIVGGANDIVYFGNLKHSSNSVVHQGDNLTGAGEGDDEQILVNLEMVPANYSKIVFVVNIYKARERAQHFGMIQNAFIRICDNETNKELLRYNLSENYDSMTAMVFGEIYRSANGWKFNAIGQPTHDDGIAELAKRYQ